MNRIKVKLKGQSTDQKLYKQIKNKLCQPIKNQINRSKARSTNLKSDQK